MWKVFVIVVTLVAVGTRYLCDVTTIKLAGSALDKVLSVDASPLSGPVGVAWRPEAIQSVVEGLGEKAGGGVAVLLEHADRLNIGT